jgi:hypothetical protein
MMVKALRLGGPLRYSLPGLLGLLLCFGLLLAGCGGGSGDGNDSGTTSGIEGLSAKTPVEDLDEAGSKASRYPSIQGSGILWKPVSESDRKLAVLLPRTMGTPKIAVLDSKENLIEYGRYTRRTNGNRPTYRFGRPGGAFPAPCLLKVGTRIYYVPDGRNRYQ